MNVHWLSPTRYNLLLNGPVERTVAVRSTWLNEQWLFVQRGYTEQIVSGIN